MAKPNIKARKSVAKVNLPTKICVVCERPFAWRKKWERDWENVRFCSGRCRRDRHPPARCA